MRASAAEAHSKTDWGASFAGPVSRQQELSRAVPVPWQPACDGPRTRSDRRMRRSRPALQSATPVASNASAVAALEKQAAAAEQARDLAIALVRRVANARTNATHARLGVALTIIPSIWAAARRATRPTRSVSWRRASTRSNDNCRERLVRVQPRPHCQGASRAAGTGGDDRVLLADGLVVGEPSIAARRDREVVDP